VRSEIKQLEKNAKYEVATIGNNYRGAIEKAGRSALGDVSDAVDDLITKALDDLARALTKQGLRQFRNAAVALRDHMRELDRRRPDLYDAGNSVSAYLQLGPIKMEWSAFLTRVDSVITSTDIWIDNPPSLHRREIKAVVQTLGPTSIDLGLSVNFALLVGSKELGVGAGIGAIQGDLIYELLDAMLEACGVPE